MSATNNTFAVTGLTCGHCVGAVTDELRQEKIVSGVYPMNDFHTMAADPYLPLQSAVADMQLNEAHRFATGRDVTVAVVPGVTV